MKVSTIFYTFILGAFVFVSCHNDTIVGSTVLEGDKLDIIFVDDVPITAITVPGDSVLTYLRNNTSQRTYMLGVTQDDIFGRAEAEVYVNAGLIGNLPNFEDPSHVVDSLVLSLKLDTLGHYGDIENATFDIDVFRITENLNDVDTIFSDQDFERSFQSIGGIADFKISIDSISVEQDSVLDTIVPQLRIHLDNSLAEELIAHEDALTGNEAFSEFLSGFFINASSSDDNTMMGLNLSTLAFQSRETELGLYYHNDTIINQKYAMFVGNISSNRFKHDYSGSDVGMAIDNPAVGQDLIYVQSMAGVNIQFDLSNVANYSDHLLNHAEIELTVANLPSFDDELEPPIEIIIGSEFNEDGNLKLIDDLLAIASVSSYIPDAVETFEEGGVTYYRYKVIITHFVNDIIKQRANSNILTLSAFSKPERPNRSVIYGPENNMFPAKLNMTFTKP